MKNQNDIQTKTTTKQGFSFVETLVAITLLLVAVVAPLSLAQDGILAARLSQDQIVAYYLAQEGLEITKNLRDNNRLQNDIDGQLGNEFAGNLSNCIVTVADLTASGCTVDARTSGGVFNTERCIGTCPPLRIDNPGTVPRTYTHTVSGTTETKYIREVKVWYPGANTSEAVVWVRVTWPFGKNEVIKEHTLQTYMYNW